MSEKKTISRRNFIGKVAGVSGAALAANVLKSSNLEAGIFSKKKTGPQRNVLLLISDDHGIDQLGCYGNELVSTPNLDAMAEEGIRFTNAFCVSASCSASRGSILSGMYPHQNGQFGHQHNWHHFSYHAWVKSIPGLLKENGYTTGLIGKLHVAPDSQIPFDYRIPSKKIMGNRDVMTMADYAGDFFNKEKDKPFFLLMGYSDPHRSAAGMTKMRNVENFSGFGNNPEYAKIEAKKFSSKDVSVPDFLQDTEAVREELADQYESISRLDTGIGDVLRQLKESGRYDDTLIIYISDNGIPFPGAKTTIYDSGTHLPMIVISPDQKGKKLVNNGFVSYIDFLPTIMEFTNSDMPGYDIPGQSFLKGLSEENPEGRQEVYMSHTFHEITMFYPMRAIRNKKYKLIENLFPELEYPFATDLFVSKTWQEILKTNRAKMGKREVKNYLMRPAFELFDIESDPSESKNLASDPAYADILNELKAKLTKMRYDTNDPWVISDNYRENTKLYKKLSSN